MKIKCIGNELIISILKNNLYLNGIIVPDHLFNIINRFSYYGYRTTTGVFLKLGGTYSKQEFEQLNNTECLLFDSEKIISYEEYLKIREYVTVDLKNELSVNKKNLKNKTYFILNTDDNGKLYIYGQYVKKNKIYQIRVDDCGIFKQKKYEDKLVAFQAGGIRLRSSICGDNCISGCSFCNFSKSSENYIPNNLNILKRKYLNKMIKKLATKEKCQTLFITGGNPNLKDMELWTKIIKENIETFKKIVPNGFIDIMLTPRGFDKYIYNKNFRYDEYRKYLLYLKSLGVNTISPNIELWKQDKLNEFCGINTAKTNIGTTKSEIDKTLKIYSKSQTKIYTERINKSLNAHNSHNTANLCCEQSLDMIEQQALKLEKDNTIISNISKINII